MKYIPVHVKYSDILNIKYTSLGHLYNEWYNAYLNVTTYPRIMIRLEDIIFHADKVVPQIYDCYGGTWVGGSRTRKEGISLLPFVANRNKGIDKNSPTSGLLGAIIRYGNPTLRRQHYQRMQFEAAKDILDPHLMEMFGYSYEEPY